MRVLDVGGGDGKVAHKLYPHSDITTVDISGGWDVLKLGIPRGNWDLILANHFIEHIHDPDFFLDECFDVMSDSTILNIGIPNLSAWFNRFFFLFGYLPHSYELSHRYNLGKPFDWDKELLGGHIRVFNVPSMVQLLKYHGFKILVVKGEYSTFPTNKFVSFVDRFLTDLNPNLASAVRIICKK